MRCVLSFLGARSLGSTFTDDRLGNIFFSSKNDEGVPVEFTLVVKENDSVYHFKKLINVTVTVTNKYAASR